MKYFTKTTITKIILKKIPKRFFRLQYGAKHQGLLRVCYTGFCVHMQRTKKTIFFESIYDDQYKSKKRGFFLIYEQER